MRTFDASISVLPLATLVVANTCIATLATSAITSFVSASTISQETSNPLPNALNSAAYMTIEIANLFGTELSLSFGVNSGFPTPQGDPQPTTLPNASKTQYVFPTGWAGRIGIGPNLSPYGSKIEGSYTGPADIDVSYVDGYSVPITCSSNGVAITGCNIELFNQSGITCGDQMDGPVCLNEAQNTPDGPAPCFFQACTGAAYTYPNDDAADFSNVASNLFVCCVGTSCMAPPRQPGATGTNCSSIKSS